MVRNTEGKEKQDGNPLVTFVLRTKEGGYVEIPEIPNSAERVIANRESDPCDEYYYYSLR